MRVEGTVGVNLRRKDAPSSVDPFATSSCSVNGEVGEKDAFVWAYYEVTRV